MTTVTNLILFFVAVKFAYTNAMCNKSEHPAPWGFSPFDSQSRVKLRREDLYKIYGGEEAEAGSWPWVASLQLYDNKTKRHGHACGAVLFKRQWLISAAHCFNDLLDEASIADYTIVLGVNNIKEKISPENRFRVELVHILPGYQYHGRAGKDVALIKLCQSPKTSKYIKPVLMSRGKVTKNLDDYDQCYVLGWGETYERSADGTIKTSRTSDVLRQLKIGLYTEDKCKTLQDTIGLLSTRVWNKDKLICTKLLEKNSGSCHGDSGGPIICRTKKRHFRKFCSVRTTLPIGSDRDCANLPDSCKTHSINQQCRACIKRRDCKEPCSILNHYYRALCRKNKGHCVKVWELIGVVSSGDTTCGVKPAVFPLLSRYLNWIKMKIVRYNKFRAEGGEQSESCDKPLPDEE